MRYMLRGMRGAFQRTGDAAPERKWGGPFAVLFTDGAGVDG